jgi:cobalt-zinc-cadmium efflux system protein
MFSDVAALGLSLFAIRLAQRPPTDKRTYGYARIEILAALVNGATLLVVAGFIVVEAWERVRQPVEIDGPVMLVVAGLGLLVNVAAALVLHGHSADNLNVRGAYLHVLGDLLGSVGTIAAGAIVLLTGWTPADPIISVLIALLILVSAWNLVKEATDVLLESVPGYLDLSDIVASLEAIEGLDDVHDVHVWKITSGFVALSGHGVIDDPAEHMRILDEVRDRMRKFGIEHVTFQIEPRTLYQLARESR